MTGKRKNMKRYNLDLPTELFDSLRAVAEQNNTTIVDVIRRFIRLGLAVEKTHDSTLYIREGDSFSKIILL
jgi:hypothetical protein